MSRLVLAAGLALLAACSAVETRGPAAGSWETHRAQLAQLEHWSATGKLALRSPQASESAALDWRQQGAQTRLRLTGPLGAGATEIHSDGRLLQVHRGDEHHIYDISSPGAVFDSTGWELPLKSLPYWLKGLPAPGAAVQVLEVDPESGRLRRLRQQDWEVLYERYGEFDSLSLPTRLRIQGSDTRATILIRHWRAGAN